MPEHLRALVYILVLATVIFMFAKPHACPIAIATRDFERRRNLWFGITFAAFLAHNFWIYIFVTAALLLFTQRSEQNKLALFFLVLFAIPPASAEIPGMGVINYFFEIDYLRVLALAVLLPAYVFIRKRPGTDPFGRLVPDKLLLGYLILNFLLMFEHSSFTNVLRNGVFYAFIDTFLPYYVASRSLRSLEDFRDALMSFVVAALILSAILFFEYARYWLLYSSLEHVLGARIGGLGYLQRGASLRASASIGHAIAAGYVVAVAIGFFIYLRKVIPASILWGLGFLLLMAGLIGPLSRGPWVGAAVILLVFLATSPATALGLAKLGIFTLIAGAVLLATPAGEILIGYLPFVGTVDTANVEFRRRLLEVSFQVFLENPVLGRYDYVETPTMQALRGNDGMVDLVNNYVIVALGRGMIGLALFGGFFLTIAFWIYKGMRSLVNMGEERYVLGQALLAVLLGILLIIGTVSPILVIPTVYWCVAGLGVAYARMLTRQKTSEATGTIRSDRDISGQLTVRPSPR